MNWLQVTRGHAPLIVSLPHTGTDIPADIEARLVSPWLARKDADWWVDRLYAFAEGMGATIVRTAISRTVIDVNRDPSGASLYPGQATTELCPTTTFDGELPQFNLGTNGGASCADALTATVEAACDASGLSRVTNGRFKGGWTTRHYGRPETGVHALQMELACRGYMDDPAEAPTPDTWPTPFHADRAEPLRAVLEDVLNACLSFARSPAA